MATLSEKDQQRFNCLAQEYFDHPQYQLMEGFIQHGSVSTYAHCARVARTAFSWACALTRVTHVRINEKDLIAGALLHDFYLYDWHDRKTSKPNHATKHPLYALENAQQCFLLSPAACNIIESHMWPLPLTRVPKSIEATLVCAADKWCCLGETLLRRGKFLQAAKAATAHNHGQSLAYPDAKATVSPVQCYDSHVAKAE